MTVNNFLLVFLLFFAAITILKYVRTPDQAIRMNSWFHILGERRKDYDFEDMLQREKRFTRLPP